MKRNTLANPFVANMFWRWLRSRVEPEVFDAIDPQEFGLDLTLSEAKLMAQRKFQGVFRPENDITRVKCIIFVRPLIEKMVAGDDPKCTYRLSPLNGFYYVRCSRFTKCRHQPPCPSNLVIEVYNVEEVNPFNLTDKDAQLAGIADQATLLKLFEKWYGGVPNKMYRNWFKVKQVDD